MGLSWASHSTSIYTSELTLCSTICVQSATWHSIHGWKVDCEQSLFSLKIRGTGTEECKTSTCKRASLTVSVTCERRWCKPLVAWELVEKRKERLHWFHTTIWMQYVKNECRCFIGSSKHLETDKSTRPQSECFYCFNVSRNGLLFRLNISR